MIRNIFSKAIYLLAVVVCAYAQEAKAQQESSERELQVASFGEADENDDDTRKASNFEGKLESTALIKVFMPGEIESTDPSPSKPIEYKETRGGGYAYYVWVEEHTNGMRIVPKNGSYQSIKIDFKDYGLQVYSLRNKEGGLQAGKVYQLVLRDPAPVYIDTHLQGTYANVDDGSQKIFADKDGRITLKDLPSGKHVVTVYAGDGSLRGSVNIDDRQKIYTLDARKKAVIYIKTNPAGGQISIINGESEETYNGAKEYAYGSYKVIANINGNRVEKNITVDDTHKTFTIDNTKSYDITPMYDGISARATVYEDSKELVVGEDNGVALYGNTYHVTRPIGTSYKYYASNYKGKSPKTSVYVSNNSPTEYQLSIAARNSIVWPWQREYDAAPVGVSFGYVRKQMVTTGGGAKLKENGIWEDGEGKWLNGMQVGIVAQPCLSWGLGLYTGLFYEAYISENDNYDYDSFVEHNIAIPVHLLYRLPFGRKCALSVHGGVGFSYAVYGAFKADDYDNLTDFYGEDGYPKRFNMALEGGVDFRVGPIQVGFLYSKGINDHKSYSSFGDFKTKYTKMGFSLAWVISTKD